MRNFRKSGCFVQVWNEFQVKFILNWFDFVNKSTTKENTNQSSLKFVYLEFIQTITF